MYVIMSDDNINSTIQVARDRKSAEFEMHVTNDFEFGPGDFDIDAEMVSVSGDNETFTLRPRETENRVQRRENHPMSKAISIGRISVTDTDVDQSRLPPTMASPAAFGYGPSLAMPSLQGMGENGPQFGNLDSSFASVLGSSMNSSTLPPSSPDRASSMIPPFSPTSTPMKEMPQIGRATVDGTEDKEEPKPLERDLSSYQFPVDEEGPPRKAALKQSLSSGSVGSKVRRN